MDKKLIAVVVLIVVMAVGVFGIYSMKKSERLESAEKIDLLQIAKQCVDNHKACQQFTSNYVSKRVEINGNFGSLKLIPQLEADLLGLEGKNIHLLRLVYNTNVQHKVRDRFVDNKTEDTLVKIECYLAEGEEKKIQDKKKEGDAISLNIVVRGNRDSGVLETAVLADWKPQFC